MSEATHTCQYCLCNGDCRLQTGEECGWADMAHTCCTNPACVKQRADAIHKGRAEYKAQTREVSQRIVKVETARKQQMRKSAERKRKLRMRARAA